MSFKLVEGPDNNKFMLANAKLPIVLSKAIRRGAYISGKELRNDLLQDMQENKSGRRYKIYKGRGGAKLNRPRFYKASAPSETPAIVTGEFRNSIDFKVIGNRTLEFGSGKDRLAPYAKFLEKGTSKMKARKPLGRTVDKLKYNVKTNITKEVNKEIRRQGFDLRKF